MSAAYHSALISIMKEKYGNEQAKDSVYLTIKEGLTSKIIPVGTTLNSAFLAKLFFLSRTPVENALSRLFQEHLIVATQPSGYITYELSFEQIKQSNEFMLQLYLAANLMARSKFDFYYENLLYKELDSLDRITNFKEYLYAGNKFHLAIGESTGNHYLMETLKNETTRSALITLDYSESEYTDDFISKHKLLDRELLEVIKEGDKLAVFEKTVIHNNHIRRYVFDNLVSYH